VRTIDLRRDLRRFYAPRPGGVELVDLPALRFVAIDGTVQPGEKPGDSAAFQDAVGALYGAAYTLKFTFKKRKLDPVDYPVMPLEGLWSPDLVEPDLSGGRREPWEYTLMILVPDEIGSGDLATAVEAVRSKRGDQPALARLRLETLEEGPCVQALHVGPYAAEPETIERMKAFAAERGLTRRGRHHEIYLGDPRRSDPDRLRTILRQPVARPA
jgi:hypothetical protein